MRLTSLTYLAAMLTVLSPAWAGTITSVTTNDNNPLNATSASFPETIAELAGTQVTFVYAGFTDSATFNSTGQAAGSDGILSVTGISISGLATFVLQNNEGGGDPIESITIKGTAAGSTSDTGIVDEPNCDEPSLCPVNASALFTSPIGLGGAPPSGNLFASGTLTFAGGGLPDADGFTFEDYTEHLTGPITSGTPEPTTFALLGGGLILLGVAFRHRRSDK